MLANQRLKMAEQDSAVSEPSAPSFEALFMKFMESTMNRLPSTSTSTPEHVAEAIPEFGGVDIGDNAEKWCDIVEKATGTLPLTQRLNLATHALTGSAKTWYASWYGHPRTWQKFREDMCAEFTSGDRLCELLVRAVTYTSDGAKSSSEYVRNKLKYYEQTGIEFKPKELISLVIGHVSDPTARQSLTNANYQTTAALKAGISQFQLGEGTRTVIKGLTMLRESRMIGTVRMIGIVRMIGTVKMIMTVNGASRAMS